MTEVALVLIKPDGLYKAIAGQVISQFIDGDLKLAGLKLVQVSRALAQEHYKHLKDQFFFDEIVSYLIGNLHAGAPVIAMALAGKNAVKKCRSIAGATNPEAARPRSVRGRFGRVTTKGVFENLVHVSSDPKEAAREIKLWFKKDQLILTKGR